MPALARTVLALAICAACGDNSAPSVPIWVGGEILAETDCGYGGTAQTQIAVDDTSVYWAGGCEDASSVDGALYRVPLAGGSPVALAEHAGWCVAGVALAAGTIYFTTGCDGTVRSAPAAGGPSTVLAIADETDGCAHDLALGGDQLYMQMSQTIRQRPLAGGTATLFAQDGVTGAGFAVDAANVYEIYSATDSSFDIHVHLDQIPLDGSDRRMLYEAPDSGDGSPGISLWSSGLAVAGNDLVFGVGGLLQHVALDTGTMTQLASVAGDAHAIAIDGDTVYWIDDHALSKTTLSGGAVATLSVNNGTPYVQASITSDANRVYWTSGCGVMAAPK